MSDEPKRGATVEGLGLTRVVRASVVAIALLLALALLVKMSGEEFGLWGSHGGRLVTIICTHDGPGSGLSCVSEPVSVRHGR